VDIAHCDVKSRSGLVRTEEVIRQLADDVRPVRPLRPLALRVASWLVVAVLSLLVVMLLMGVRRELGDAADRTDFAVEAMLLVLTAVSAAVGALLVSIPGAGESRRVRWVPVGLGVACLMLAAGEWAYAAATGAPTGRLTFAWHCVYKTTSVAAVPGIVLFVMLRRGAPLHAAWAGLLALLATTAVGVLGANIICPNDRPLHMLLWHVLPLMIFSGAGAALGRWLLRW
jgi:hypothetical protein